MTLVGRTRARRRSDFYGRKTSCSRERYGLCSIGECTQDERALKLFLGEVSFAHRGRGEFPTPRKRPRVSGARKRAFLARSLLFKSARGDKFPSQKRAS